MSTRSKSSAYRNLANVLKLKQRLKEKMKMVDEECATITKRFRQLVDDCKAKTDHVLSLNEIAFTNDYSEVSRCLDFLGERMFRIRTELEQDLESYNLRSVDSTDSTDNKTNTGVSLIEACKEKFALLADDIFKRIQLSQSKFLRAGKMIKALELSIDHFISNGNWQLKNPKKGMFCAASYSKDGYWYRAKITDVKHGTDGRKEVDVFYIDYGNNETLKDDDITVLLPEFLDYEPQAVRCCLSYVESSKTWSQETIDLFRSTIENNSLNAYFYQGDIHDSNEVLYSVELYAGSSDNAINCLELLPRDELCPL
ncbi:uncharacterized protein B4U79_17484 [Dinothrombium tinctorium]|uniref:Tudor domain-containing protein n=1 Tax=Dinothrombium tinctorium TaxID=1965070 RepID=A0A3S3PLB1_9ACAR|nr:uncharacterized protein B4U79_17487 [Dinothrombium tinctorium]RWS12102.1 uncharacterized protein B4U79_17484 [Dinothrombium tinctorium]